MVSINGQSNFVVRTLHPFSLFPKGSQVFHFPVPFPISQVFPSTFSTNRLLNNYETQPWPVQLVYLRFIITVPFLVIPEREHWMQSAKVTNAGARSGEGSSSMHTMNKKARSEPFQVIKNKSQLHFAQIFRVTSCFPSEFLRHTNVRMMFAADVRTLTSFFSQSAKDRLTV